MATAIINEPSCHDGLFEWVASRSSACTGGRAVVRMRSFYFLSAGNLEGQDRRPQVKTDHNVACQFRGGAVAKTLAESLKKIAVLFTGTLLLAPSNVTGAEKPAEEQQTFPDGQGFALGLVYRADVFSNVSGGDKTGNDCVG